MALWEEQNLPKYLLVQKRKKNDQTDHNPIGLNCNGYLFTCVPKRKKNEQTDHIPFGLNCHSSVWEYVYFGVTGSN